MCGIVGVLKRDHRQTVDRRLLNAMTEIITHRGPDDSGIYLKDNVGLGHRRLSIIDLSDHGAQPMSSGDEN